MSNFIDMSGLGRSEGTLFYKLLQRLTEKRSIKFMSLARNNLDRAPYSSLSLINNTLEYLSLAGNNFGLLNASIIKGTWSPGPLELGLGIELLSNVCGLINFLVYVSVSVPLSARQTTDPTGPRSQCWRI